MENNKITDCKCDERISFFQIEDPVNSPEHYNALPLEAIDIIQKTLTPEQFKGYLFGNALKYRLRAGHKKDAAEDIAKAIWYESKLASL